MNLLHKRYRSNPAFSILCGFVLLSLFLSQAYGQQPQPKTEAIIQIQQRIESMKETMRAMGASQLPDAPPIKESTRSPISLPQKPMPISNDEIYFAQVDTENQENEQTESNRGLYFMPFYGFSIGHEGAVTLNTTIPNYEPLDSETGSSYGLRVGYSWKYFYLEERVGINSMDLNNEITTIGGIGHTIGELKSLSFQQALGAKIPLSEKIFFNLGIGVGLSQMKFNYSILAPDGSNIPSKNLEDWALSYDAIFGLEFYPFSHLMAGINYRWSRIEEIDHFSAHDLHLIEGSLGFIF